MNDEAIEQAILEQLQNGRMKIDDIIRQTGLVAYQVSAAMTMLELKRLVVHEAGHFSLAAKRERVPLPLGVALKVLPPRSNGYESGSMLGVLSQL